MNKLEFPMIDRAKRITLKRLGSAAVAVTAASTSPQLLASHADQNTKLVDGTATTPVADINVHTRVSATSNDVEVVITNAGDRLTRITQMTPSQTVTKRGRFDFASVLENGELALAPGQHVTIPMKPHAVVLDASSSAGQRAESLTCALRKSFSVITEGESFARVTIIDQIRFA